LTVIATADVFTTAHIAYTATVTAVLAFAGALLVFRRRSALVESLLIGVLSGAAVFLWRKSANMPQLNSDGLNGFSANDWLAPVVTFMVLGLYKAVRAPTDDRRFAQACAIAVVVALVVNVVTI
jgi:hypothetical protein